MSVFKLLKLKIVLNFELILMLKTDQWRFFQILHERLVLFRFYQSILNFAFFNFKFLFKFFLFGFFLKLLSFNSVLQSFSFSLSGSEIFQKAGRFPFHFLSLVYLHKLLFLLVDLRRFLNDLQQIYWIL